MQAEEALQRSGIPYTIVRPGGLKSGPVNEGDGGVVLAPADALSSGSINRSLVADICVESLLIDAAENRIVECICRQGEPKRPIGELFGSL